MIWIFNFNHAKDIDMVSLAVHFTIDSIDRRMFEFALGTADETKLDIIERNGLGF